MTSTTKITGCHWPRNCSDSRGRLNVRNPVVPNRLPGDHTTVTEETDDEGWEVCQTGKHRLLDEAEDKTLCIWGVQQDHPTHRALAEFSDRLGGTINTCNWRGTGKDRHLALGFHVRPVEVIFKVWRRPGSA